MPGPGNYELTESTSNKAFTFNSKQEEKYNRNPGPGAYEADHNKTKDASRTFAIGSEKRQTQFGNDKDQQNMPGPGNYEVTETNNVQTFSFNSKQDEKYNNNPGPGTYNADHNNTKDSSRTYVIGSEKRQTQFGNNKDQQNMPGPGNYELTDTNNV